MGTSNHRFRLALGILTVLVIGLAAGAWTYPRVRDDKVQELMADAERGAVAFTQAELDQLAGATHDVITPTYRIVKSRLQRLRSIGGRARFTYLMRQRMGSREVVFLCDSEAEDSESISLPGEAYPEAQESYGLQAILENASSQWEGPLHDSFGTWVTGYAVAAWNPDGTVRDVFGIDVDARDWSSSLLWGSFRSSIYVWITLGLPLALWAVGRQQRLLGGRVRQLSDALDQSFAAVVMADLQGVLTYANGGFERQTRFTANEVVGRSWLDFSPVDLPREDLMAIWCQVRAGHTWHGQWTNRRKDGAAYPVFGMVSPVRDRNGTLSGYIVIFEDVTQLKQIEADLRSAKEQAETANEAKSRFLATMSHEIRTPLNGIIGVASLLERSEPSAEQRELIQVIQRSGESLLVIINDILDLSRIEAGKMELEEQPFDLTACIDEVAALFRGLVESKQLFLRIECNSSIPARAVGDVARFRQVLNNLIGNAVKFTEEGGISVRVRLRSTGPAAHVVEVRVKDTGIGIAAEKRDRLFAAFSQVDASITRRFGGTGLGLVICKRLCLLMGGDIECHSEVGHGSEFVFWVTLGATDDSAVTSDGTPAAKKKVRNRSDLRLLLVEDNPVNRTVATKMLQTMGCVATVAVNGAEAVAACRERVFDVILMDVQMPIMDGLTATKHIRSEPLLHQPWIIAVTADALIGDREKCLAAGMNDYLSKPLIARALDDALSRVPSPDTRGLAA